MERSRKAKPLSPQQQRIADLVSENEQLKAEKAYLIGELAQAKLKLNQANARLKEQDGSKVLVAQWIGGTR